MIIYLLRIVYEIEWLIADIPAVKNPARAKNKDFGLFLMFISQFKPLLWSATFVVWGLFCGLKWICWLALASLANLACFRGRRGDALCSGNPLFHISSPKSLACDHLLKIERLISNVPAVWSPVRAEKGVFWFWHFLTYSGWVGPLLYLHAHTYTVYAYIYILSKSYTYVYICTLIIICL